MTSLVEHKSIAAAAPLAALGVFQPKFRGQRHSSRSMFVIDGKGVLWEDAIALAAERGWRHRVIGIEQGEYGLDLFDGLEPAAIVSAIREARTQIDGTSTDANPIFKNMALEILHACLTVARVYELTDGGLERVRKTCERLYSPAFVTTLYSSVLDPAGELFRVVNSILETAKDSSRCKVIAPLLTIDVWAAIAFLRRDLLKTYPVETVGSFLTNCHQMMAGFAANQAIRAQFGAARGRMLDVDSLWDDRTVTCFRLSPQTGLGETARMVAILTKLRLYNHAAVRQLIDKEVGRFAKMTVVMDEAQELVTSGQMGEAAVTAWTRSTGLSFILATQSLAGLYSRIGHDSTHSLLSNLRTKIFLQTEEPADREYIGKLGGEVRRSLMGAADEYESWHARQLELEGAIDDDVRPAAADRVDWSVRRDVVLGAAAPVQLQPQAMKALDKHGLLDTLTQLAYGARFVGANAEAGRTDAAEASAEYQVMQARLTMLNRQEDQTRAFVLGSNELRPLWSGQDLTGLGMGQAIVFVNRAGVMRTDRIKLNPELAKRRAPGADTFDSAQPGEAGARESLESLAQSAADAVLARRAAVLVRK